MVVALEEEIENALNLVVTTAEQSSNMKKALKEKIFETVSSPRQLFCKLKKSSDQKSSEINNQTKRISKLEAELLSCRRKHTEIQQLPSIASMDKQTRPREGKHGSTSAGQSPTLIKEYAQRVALPTGTMSRQYSTLVKEVKPRRFKMTIRSRKAQPPEEIKRILKAKVNPGGINVGVTTLKSLNESVLVETNSKEEIEVLGKEIQDKCGDLEPHIHRLRNPRIIIINVPEDTNIDNIEEAIIG
jgi:hypothetical protein